MHMGLPAHTREPQMSIDERVATLETHVGHIHADMGEIKTDIREMRHDVANLREDMHTGFAQMNASLTSAKFWALFLYLALAASLFGVMARGFGWI